MSPTGAARAAEPRLTWTTWDPRAGWVAGACTFVLLVLAAVFKTPSKQREDKGASSRPSRGMEQGDAARSAANSYPNDDRAGAMRSGGQGSGTTVRRLSVAFDPGARRELQDTLAEIARRTRSADLSASGRAALGALAASIEHARAMAWESGSYLPAQAPKVFDAIVDSLRKRFTTVTRGIDAVAPPPGLRALDEEGPGFVVVSIVVETDGPTPPLPIRATREALVHAIDALMPPVSANDSLRALRVVWSPAEDEDRLSSMELGALYPELIALEGAEELGQRDCLYCHAAYAAELGACPCCGAPESEAQRGGRQSADAFLAEATCGHCDARFAGHHYRCPSCGARRFEREVA